jgi:hypothetical protein
MEFKSIVKFLFFALVFVVFMNVLWPFIIYVFNGLLSASMIGTLVNGLIVPVLNVFVSPSLGTLNIILSFSMGLVILSLVGRFIVGRIKS